jgi:hypothetical protein
LRPPLRTYGPRNLVEGGGLYQLVAIAIASVSVPSPPTCIV